MLRVFWRASVVLLCYGLSAYGLLACAMLLGAVQEAGLLGALLFLLMLWAWLGHMWMSLAWIADRQVLPVLWQSSAGAALGVWLLFPWVAGLGDGGVLAMLKNLLSAWAMGLVFLFPCHALAIYLCRYHARDQAQTRHFLPEDESLR